VKPLLTADEMRAADRAAIEVMGIPGVQLMETAGAKVARYLLGSGIAVPGARAIVVCGKGNNGGDGLVTARVLKTQSVDATCVLLGAVSDLRGEARAAAERLMDAGVTVAEIRDEGAFDSLLRGQHVVIDALFGTGLSSAPTGLHASVIRSINHSGLPVVSIDIPSGVDATSGWAFDPAVCATATVTMGAEKLGLRLYPGRGLAGQVEIADIGFPAGLLEQGCSCVTPEVCDIRKALPPRRPNGHKGTFGSVLVVAGSPGFCGAAVLAAQGAARSGAGLVHLAVPQSLSEVIEPGHIESVKHRLPDDGRGLIGPGATDAVLRLAESASCVAVGPGIGTDKSTVVFLAEVLHRIQAPIVIDADGINCLANTLRSLTARTGPTVLTPHPGEMARLIGESAESVNAGRVDVARRVARQYECTVVLKGAPTVTASEQGPIVVNPTGNSGLAKGGSGDVLTGLLAGLIAQGATPAEAAMTAVFLHGRAADIAAAGLTEYCLCAGDIVGFLPHAFASILAGS
jgi:NAD(P)H-hydrate epimerase